MTIPAVTILPLRAFLGITFVYAAFQKLTDPGFFTPGAGTYIGAQLLGFSRGSPIGFILRHLAEHAVFFGTLTILAEFAIGTAVLLGLFTRLAALGGLGLNLIFFLSASWRTFPYFMGSDIVFVVAWLTLAITGPGPWALDDAVWRTRIIPDAYRRLVLGQLPATVADDERERENAVMTRREVVAGIGAALVMVVLGLIPRSQPAATGPMAGAGSTGTKKGSSGSSGGQKIGNVSQVPANSSATFTAPNGDPAVFVHTSGSHYYAYDAVCTHAGCTVQYDPAYKLLVCPCHGGAYDPAHGAQVVAGPPPSPLTAIPIRIDSQGNIYLT